MFMSHISTVNEEFCANASHSFQPSFVVTSVAELNDRLEQAENQIAHGQTEDAIVFFERFFHQHHLV